MFKLTIVQIGKTFRVNDTIVDIPYLTSEVIDEVDRIIDTIYTKKTPIVQLDINNEKIRIKKELLTEKLNRINQKAEIKNFVVTLMFGLTNNINIDIIN